MTGDVVVVVVVAAAIIGAFGGGLFVLWSIERGIRRHAPRGRHSDGMIAADAYHATKRSRFK